MLSVNSDFWAQKSDYQWILENLVASGLEAGSDDAEEIQIMEAICQRQRNPFQERQHSRELAGVLL